MPANVANFVPAVTPLVFPNLTYLSLSKSSEWATLVSQYPDGSSQRYSLPAGSPAKARARFRLRARLGATAMAALRAFYASVKGQKDGFYWYMPWERTVPFTYDPTGTETDGRYSVRFASEWRQEWTLGRGIVELELVEIT